MTGWRYYVRRPVSREWLDTNAQLSEVVLDWSLSGPNTAQATLLDGLGNMKGSDGKPVFSKFRTELFVEEDGKLIWGGVCTSAAPNGKNGTTVEFVSPSGILQRVPYMEERRWWTSDAIEMINYLVAYASGRRNAIQVYVDKEKSAYTLGDGQPPSRPTPPARPKGWTMAQYQASAEYKRWKAADDAWVAQYKDYKPFELLWWEAPYVGEEIDNICKMFNIDYRDTVSWQGPMNPRYDIVVRDNIVRRRADIRLEDGVNLAEALDPTDDEEEFATELIGLGAGEGRSMVRTSVSNPQDDRVYQGVYVSHKSVRNPNTLRALLTPEFNLLNQDDMQVDQATVWDTPGFASVASLQPGDEVSVLSRYTSPRVSTWRKIVGIARSQDSAKVALELDRA